MSERDTRPKRAKPRIRRGDTSPALRRLALRGNADAMWRLGEQRLYRSQTPKLGGAKSSTALWWFRRAARSGNLEYQFQLGTMLIEGYGGLPVQLSRGIELIRKAARKGHGGAQYQLGVYFGTGAGGLRRDRVESVKWYEKAAAQGNTMAMYNLAVAFSSAEAVKSMEKARNWLVKGAKLGNLECLEWLSKCADTGELGFDVGSDLSKILKD